MFWRSVNWLAWLRVLMSGFTVPTRRAAANDRLCGPGGCLQGWAIYRPGEPACLALTGLLIADFHFRRWTPASGCSFLGLRGGGLILGVSPGALAWFQGVAWRWCWAQDCHVSPD